MHWTELLFGILLIVLLFGLAGYFGWRQVYTLRRLRDDAEMPPEECSYLRRRSWRRLLGSLLMIVVAGLFAGALLMEGPAQQLVEYRLQTGEDGEPPDLDADQKRFARFWGAYWIALLLVLLALVTTAGVDFLATCRYGLRQLRRIQADRRAMIERQAARLRGQRNGHH